MSSTGPVMNSPKRSVVSPKRSVNSPERLISSPDMVIECKELRVHMGAHLALDAVDWQLPAGVRCAIVGPNGAGKSTLLKALLGLVNISSGSVKVLGKTPGQAAQHVGYVPQVRHVDRSFPALPEELVATGMAPRWPWSRSIVREACATLERVGLGDRCGRPLTALSGGELQRVYLARALVRNPKIIVLDEPATGLDMTATTDLHRLLDDERARSGAAVVMVTHDWGAAQHHADQVMVLNRRVLALGPPNEVLGGEALERAFGHHGHHHHMHPGPCDHTDEPVSEPSCGPSHD